MKCLINVLILFVVLGNIAIPRAASQALTLSEALNAAERHSPLTRQGAVSDAINERQRANLHKNYLPQLELNAQATWQSEVTRISLPDDLPFSLAITPPPQDQYRATLDVRQNLWDGGLTAAQLTIQQAGHEAELQQLAVDLYQLRERVQQLYFTALLADAQVTLSRLLLDDLTPRVRKVEAAIDQGTALPLNLRVLQAEQIRARQRLDEWEATRSGALRALSVLTGLSLGPEVRLERPTFPAPLSLTAPAAAGRPEWRLFAAQEQVLQSQEDLLAARNRPRLSAFATGGYGRPGLNLLADSFEPYFIGGLSLKWSFSDGLLGRTANERQVLTLQREAVSLRRETFDQNVNAQAVRLQADIERYERQLQQDDELIDLRRRNREVAAAQLDLGIMTATDYANELNAELQARESKALHELQLLQARWQLGWLIGRSEE